MFKKLWIKFLQVLRIISEMTDELGRQAPYIFNDVRNSRNGGRRFFLCVLEIRIQVVECKLVYIDLLSDDVLQVAALTPGDIYGDSNQPRPQLLGLRLSGQ